MGQPFACKIGFITEETDLVGAEPLPEVSAMRLISDFLNQKF